jgi:hypothetical protein
MELAAMETTMLADDRTGWQKCCTQTSLGSGRFSSKFKM